jgi:DNA-binding PadR family transcriptional regulator
MPERKRRMVIECCPPPACCDMRGMLSFLIMHLLSKKDMTLYPTLKYMEKRGVVQSYKDGNLKYYRLTKDGKEGLQQAKEFFIQAYGDILQEGR